MLNFWRNREFKIDILYDADNIYSNAFTYLLIVCIVIFYGFIFAIPLHHDDVIKWKHFPRNWPFVRGIHRSPVNSPHKGQWRGAFMFSLVCTRINGWVNNREAGDLRRYRAHCDVTVISNGCGGMMIQVRAWMSNYISMFYVDVITYPYHNPTAGSAKQNTQCNKHVLT